MINLKIRSLLEQNIDLEYQSFSSGLLPGVDDILGVRIPILRSLAKDIVKNNQYLEFKKSMDHPVFEEKMLLGLSLSYMPWESSLLKEIQDFVPYIDNWSICDSFCVGLKQVRQNQKIVWSFLESYFKSTQEYEVRFAVVLSLFHFLNDEYLEKCLQKWSSIQHHTYYTQMAVAWGLTSAYTHSKEMLREYLLKQKFPLIISNMALQKIRDSKKIPKSESRALSEVFLNILKKPPKTTKSHKPE